MKLQAKVDLDFFAPDVSNENNLEINGHRSDRNTKCVRFILVLFILFFLSCSTTTCIVALSGQFSLFQLFESEQTNSPHIQGATWRQRIKNIHQVYRTNIQLLIQLTHKSARTVCSTVWFMWPRVFVSRTQIIEALSFAEPKLKSRELKHCLFFLRSNHEMVYWIFRN